MQICVSGNANAYFKETTFVTKIILNGPNSTSNNIHEINVVALGKGYLFHYLYKVTLHLLKTLYSYR